MPSKYDYVPEGADPFAKKEDYDIVEVIPVSDPNSATMAQRIMQYQAVMQMAQQAPQIYDLPELHRQMIEVLGVKNANKLVPIDDDMKPRDPVSENMAFLSGKPTKAFIYQDHDAHIAVHTSMMQDPLLMAQIGQNPQAQKMMAEIQAHIAEHLAYAYRKKIEEALGVPLPKPNEELPEDVEVELSRLVAQDPMVQLQQAELQIRSQEAQTKAMKVQGDLAAKQAEIQLKAQEVAARQGGNPELEAQKAMMQMKISEEEHALKMRQSQQEHDLKMQQDMQMAAIKARQALMKSMTNSAAKPPNKKGDK
jgi:hypothetical protein